jgi:hypothetical protein
MNDQDPYRLRQKSLEEVCEWIAGWNDGSGLGKRLIGETELKRRISRPEAIRSWIAIGIALAALIVAIFKP